MNTNAFTALVQVEEATAGTELNGQPPRSWDVVAVLRGDLKPWTAGGVSGSEGEVGQQILAQMTHRLWTRRENLSANSRHRLKVTTQANQVKHLEVLQVVEWQGRPDFYEWRCREIE